MRVRLEPNDLALALQQADVLARSSQYAKVLDVLSAAEPLAVGADQAEQVLVRRLECELAGGTLLGHADALARELAAGRQSGVEPWYRLARLREAVRQWPTAEAAIKQALAAPGGAERSDVWAAAARVREGAGHLAEAGDALRRLADLDRKDRPSHLRDRARLEARLGRVSEALAVGRELLAAAPNDPAHYRFVAQLCLRVGARDEATDVLRRAVRVDPNDPSALAALAEALVESGRPEEAIELNWRGSARLTTRPANAPSQGRWPGFTSRLTSSTALSSGWTAFVAIATATRRLAAS